VGDVKGIDTQGMVHAVLACDFPRLVKKHRKRIFVLFNMLSAFEQAVDFLRGNE